MVLTLTLYKTFSIYFLYYYLLASCLLYLIYQTGYNTTVWKRLKLLDTKRIYLCKKRERGDFAHLNQLSRTDPASAASCVENAAVQKKIDNYCLCARVHRASLRYFCIWNFYFA